VLTARRKKRNTVEACVRFPRGAASIRSSSVAQEK
jgi:hypothetical protein